MIEINSYSSTHSFGSNTYIVFSESECIIIDPSIPFNRSLLREHRPRYIILTHAHFDHFLDIDSWQAETGATVLVSDRDRPALSDPFRNCYRLFLGADKGYFGECTSVSDGDLLLVGDDAFKIIGCPGHTPGSVTILFDGHAFVGDTVFAGGGYGRYDLPGGDPDSLLASIRAISALPDDTVLYPGHGEATTVKEYKKYFHI